jgi:RNA polymerase sigma-70 factor (ECF subfamily)
VDDAGLIALARRGDAVAFSRLFAGFERRIFRYAAHMCGRDAADDVVQETFLAVLRPSASFRAGPSTSLSAGYDPGKGTVANYLFGIARHCVLKRLSAREVATFDLDEHDERTAWPDDRPSVLESLSREETIQAVRAAIASLPAAYREAVVLCGLQEMTYADAAAIARCPVGTVRSRLHRAKALLTTKLSATHSGADLVRSATK